MNKTKRQLIELNILPDLEMRISMDQSKRVRYWNDIYIIRKRWIWDRNKYYETLIIVPLNINDRMHKQEFFISKFINYQWRKWYSIIESITWIYE
jgi:hypothetical protein